ncbi:MAG: helix-turn-helix domain-containing protein [Rickettsiales bacterium]|jgi:cytoskeletal protein RodZ|nr:helix-turn-helix domain-containing protein [Rickettsiales bacterium]
MQIKTENTAIKLLIYAKHVGDCLRYSREQCNIGQRDLARKLNIPRKFLAHIENGKEVISKYILSRLFCNGIKSYFDLHPTI